ncbi:CCA tRNA nucleotidyltransferase [archaeon]|jgi:tRNA nucleotidyltransferase (CCA-adding enzyme)|nr:CCA tRNA nucleotidyltransferase [archaeon]MBT3731234.1 CCA tRNA nucleotidyltransferase [archaeon]MBT4670012.1 CCA tRNA nucleotidyltransferase [archaeon]MBT5287786.1 CCA tRNA nucleotidyltransferase [archaeon]MBT7052791.1 CCA tRNA nucleotidyltransferase [archaeon]
MPWRKEVLKEIKPSKKNELELRKVANKIINSIKIKNVKSVLGGSSAKGTWLKGNHDIDIYVKFDQKYYSGIDISEVLKKKIKKANVLHGSRDYFKLDVKGYDIELIPIMDIKKVEDADNITDISPFHKKWVRKHKEYVNDVRLAKAFAKANGLYGAESYIKGFSGYALEVLTIYYGGFDKLIENVAKWKSKTVLDPENYHNGKVVLNKSKMFSPLIVVDPVQDTRNVAAVISKEKYELFKKIAKKFLKSKNKAEFFIRDEFDLDLLKKKKGELICLEVLPLDGKRDVVGAKLLKSFDFIKKRLEENEFKVKKSGWHWEEKAILWFLLDKVELSKEVKHYGPEIKSKERMKKFKAKWKDKKILNEDGISYVIRDRNYMKAQNLVLDLGEDSFVKNRVSKILGFK